MLIIHCAYYIHLFFTVSVNAILVDSFLSTTVFSFYHLVGREDLGFSWEGKHDKHEMLCYFCCYLALKWEVKLM